VTGAIDGPYGSFPVIRGFLVISTAASSADHQRQIKNVRILLQLLKWSVYVGDHWSSVHRMQSATFKSIRSLQPLFDRVLVQRFKAETKTATGIFLPSSATANPLPEATVIAVGPGAPGKVCATLIATS
jgi:hypothetical protein